MVVEAEHESGLGSTVTVVVKRGVLRKGDIVVCGATSGRARSLTNDQGQVVEASGEARLARLAATYGRAAGGRQRVLPGHAAQVHGLRNVADAGALLFAVETERTARRHINAVQHVQAQEEARLDFQHAAEAATLARRDRVVRLTAMMEVRRPAHWLRARDRAVRRRPTRPWTPDRAARCGIA